MTNKLLQFSDIDNGQYNVEINLGELGIDIEQFKESINIIKNEDKDFKEICNINGKILKYTSETLLPDKVKRRKQKILFVLGNPATHSIRNKMFFFSQAGVRHHRHKFWGKLYKAGLLDSELIIRECAEKLTSDFFDRRGKEAELRKKYILSGKTSKNYIIGLTTFYSFPTPVNGPYKNVDGVEKLFKPIREKIREMEYKRIKDYPFSKNALLVFTQKSSWEYVCSKTNSDDKPLYWPERNSSGEDFEKQIIRCDKK